MAWHKGSRLLDNKGMWKFGEEDVPLKVGILPCKNGNGCMNVGEHHYKKDQYSYRTNYCPYHFLQVNTVIGFYRLYYYTDENGISYLYNFGTQCDYEQGKYNFTPTPPKIGDYYAPIFSKTYKTEYGPHTIECLYRNGFNGDFSTAPSYPQNLIDFFTKAQNLKRSIAFLKKLSSSLSDLSDLINELWTMSMNIPPKGDAALFDGEDYGRFMNIFAAYNLAPQDALRKNLNLMKEIKTEYIITLNQDKPFAKKDNGKMAGEEYYHPLNAFWENGDKKGIYRSLDFERERFYQRGVGGSKFSLFNCYEISNGIK